MRITLLLVSFLLCYYYCIVSITHASPKCLYDQQSLLLQFKNNLTFDPKYSTTLKFWNNSTDCCYWNSVTCDNEGHVIGLDLSDEYFTYGGFNNSSSLFSLRHLQELYLSYTNFNSSIPSGFSKLEKLTILDLSNSHFYGTLSNSISNLTHLTYLDLSHNDLSGAIPSSLFTLPSLEKIHLEYNQFSKFEKFINVSSYDHNSMSNLTHLTHLNLDHNDLSGTIPSCLFTLPSLVDIHLEYNQFSQFDKFINVSSYALETLDLSSNNLSGPFPMPIFQLHSLSYLDLSSNRLNGSLQLDELLEFRNLTILDLSYNNISINVNDSNVNQTSFPNIKILNLASCNLKTFPRFLINQSALESLDLSDNQIHGKIPNWIWELQDLEILNISHNFLTDFEGPLQNITSSLYFIDLHNNQLQGSILVFPKTAVILDYSNNNFSVVPQDIGKYLSSTKFLFLSYNNLHGNIPDSICNASELQVLDISFNNISGTIPPCLITTTRTLVALNLRKNNITGSIPDMFPVSCNVRTLNFNGNILHGPIPNSLSHCSSLKVFDIGSNHIFGGFPCFLKNIPTLKVLVLRNNKFHGSIECSHSQANIGWTMIQVLDISLNNFNGKLPDKYFINWDRMMYDDVVSNYSLTHDNIIFRSEVISLVVEPSKEFEYYSLTITIKGQQMELVNILKIIRAIDFSSNFFEGPIPNLLMHFKELYVLNFSNNAFSGKIPSTIGNLKQLESLDLSNNSLVGEIPMELASLSFLSYLNLSFNHLVGKIPTGTQLQSFQESSFEGNYGLYGPPLTEIPKRPFDPQPQPARGRLSCSIEWSFLSVELGFVFGIGVIIGPIMFWKQWRVRYWKLVDKILCWMFSRMYLEYATDRGKTYTVLRW
ncbi:receptor protein [Trifolium repens]|nr:receptor protein [Trifolium repens]